MASQNRRLLFGFQRERERHRPATGDEGSSIPSIQMDKTKKKKKESKHRIFHAPVHMYYGQDP